jgi:hypothetical protein
VYQVHGYPWNLVSIRNETQSPFKTAGKARVNHKVHGINRMETSS